MSIKTPQEIEVMAEGGRRLAIIRQELADMVRPGITTEEIDELADRLITKSGGKASFKMVPGYHHATCINVNEVVVHGVPGKLKIEAGDVVGIDVGIFWRGWHTDTSVTVRVSEPDSRRAREKERFLETGRAALAKAVNEVRVGKRVMDISRAMQETVENAGYSVVKALTGHGVGRELHEEPAVPCFALGQYTRSPILTPGMVLAVEVMYNEGKSDVVYKNTDGWTIITADGKISGLFEETVAVTPEGPLVLTQTQKNE